MWDTKSAVSIQFPVCARLRMLTLGKTANLNNSLNGGFLLDKQRAIEEVPIIKTSLYIIKKDKRPFLISLNINFHSKIVSVGIDI